MQFPTNREITGTSISQISVRVWIGVNEGKIKLEAVFLFGGDDNGTSGRMNEKQIKQVKCTTSWHQVLISMKNGKIAGPKLEDSISSLQEPNVAYRNCIYLHSINCAAHMTMENAVRLQSCIQENRFSTVKDTFLGKCNLLFAIPWPSLE